VTYRDVVIFVTILALLPRAFLQPFFGLLLFSWLAYMRPHDLCWGFAKEWRYSLYCAILMYSGWALFERRRFTRFGAPIAWASIFLLFTTISLLNAATETGSRQFGKYFELLKVFSVTYFTIGMIDTKSRLEKIIWVITVSLGFYGVKCGLFGLLRGGRILQGPGGMMMDNNDLCLAMAMNIPLLFFMGRQSGKRWVYRSCLIAIALTCVTVVCTLSRGGILSTCLVGVLMLYKLKRRILPWLVMGAIAAATPVLLPKDVKARLATLQNPAQEGSAAGRMHAWRVGMRMIADHPLLGVGFEGFLRNFRRYDPIDERLRFDVRDARVAHNTYLQVWAELGTFALIAFLGMLFSTLRWLRRARRMAKVRDGPSWIASYADMFEVCFIGFMFGANFLNRAHFDLLYHLVAIAMAFVFVARREIAEVEAAAATAEPRGPAPAARPALAGYR